MASRAALARLTSVAAPRALSTNAVAATSRAALATTPVPRVPRSASRYLVGAGQRRMASSDDGASTMVSTHSSTSARAATCALLGDKGRPRSDVLDAAGGISRIRPPEKKTVYNQTLACNDDGKMRRYETCMLTMGTDRP